MSLTQEQADALTRGESVSLSKPMNLSLQIIDPSVLVLVQDGYGVQIIPEHAKAIVEALEIAAHVS